MLSGLLPLTLAQSMAASASAFTSPAKNEAERRQAIDAAWQAWQGEGDASAGSSGPASVSRAPHTRNFQGPCIDRSRGRPLRAPKKGFARLASAAMENRARRTDAAYLVAAHNVQPESNFLDALALAEDAFPAVGEHDGRLMVQTLQGSLQRSRTSTGGRLARTASNRAHRAPNNNRATYHHRSSVVHEHEDGACSGRSRTLGLQLRVLDFRAAARRHL